jgi:hypothetical protein
MKAANLFFKSSFNISPFAAALLALLVAFCPTATQANSIALSFKNAGARANGSDYTAGWAFSLSRPILVTDLGVFDSNNRKIFGPPGDGLLESHLVTIWNALGVEVAQATVPSRTSGSLIDGFRYVTLASPISLLPGNYTIGFYSESFHDSTALSAAQITTAPELIYTGTRSEYGNAFPSDNALLFFDGAFGPNFQFLPSGVPDSGNSLTQLISSLAVLVLIGRVRPKVLP